MSSPGHTYELHLTDTRECAKNGKRYKYCIYDYFTVGIHSGISFWYFVTKREALKQYPTAKL
jgi:hypothetical protein